MDPRALLLLFLVGSGIVKEQEPNNSLGQAQFIGDVYQQDNRIRVYGSMRYPADIDFYVCRVHEPTALRISVVTGAVSFPLIPGVPLGGMAFAPWLQITNASGELLADVLGYSGNILIPDLEIPAPTTLYFRIVSLGPALYPKRVPDEYRLKVVDSLAP